MLTALSTYDRRTKFNFGLLSTFIAIALLFGGASRADALSQPVVRLAAVLTIAIFAVQFDRKAWRAVRPALLFAAAIAAIIAVQLVPLPPSLWDTLPGREVYREALNLAGLPAVWRPLSLTPDLTLNALLSVLPPLAAILGLGLLDRRLWLQLVPVLLIAVAISAIVGVAQVSSGLFYFYRITNEGSLVGFFANRNHQAILLAMALPLLACWAGLPGGNPAFARLRGWIALCAGVAIFPLLLVTGSRGGLIEGTIGALAAILLTIMRRREHRLPILPSDLRSRLLLLAPLAAGVLAVGATIYLARDEAIQRLQEAPAEETRTRNVPVILGMAREYLPLGTGFGAFDATFRAHESEAELSALYLNHAHNDVLEVVVEGGLLPVPLAMLFLAWLAVRSWRVWRAPRGAEGRLAGRTGSVLVLMMLLGSVLDYPLRTPLMAVLFAIAAVWMHAERPRGEGESTV